LRSLSAVPVTSASAAVTARCTGWSGSTYPFGSIPAWQAKQMKPACLPEQLLWIGPGLSPLRNNAAAAASFDGTCGPHSRSAALLPAAASIFSAVATWRGSALWDEQASASSASPKPYLSPAPLSTSGSA
jgi:hypothetical protein